MVLPLLTILPGNHASIVYQGELKSAFERSGASFAEISATVTSAGSNDDVQIVDLKSRTIAAQKVSLQQREATLRLRIQYHGDTENDIMHHLERSSRHFIGLYDSCSKVEGGVSAAGSEAQMPVIELQLGQADPVKIQRQASMTGIIAPFDVCSKSDPKDCFWSMGHSDCCFEFGGTMWGSAACLAVHIDSQGGSTSPADCHVEHMLWYDASSVCLTKDTEKILSKCSWSRRAGFTFRSKSTQGMSIVKRLNGDGHDSGYIASIRAIIVYIYPKFQYYAPEKRGQMASSPAAVIRDSVNSSLHGLKSIMAPHASNPDPIHLIVESLTGATF